MKTPKHRILPIGEGQIGELFNLQAGELISHVNKETFDLFLKGQNPFPKEEYFFVDEFFRNDDFICSHDFKKIMKENFPFPMEKEKRYMLDVVLNTTESISEKKIIDKLSDENIYYSLPYQILEICENFDKNINFLPLSIFILKGLKRFPIFVKVSPVFGDRKKLFFDISDQAKPGSLNSAKVFANKLKARH